MEKNRLKREALMKPNRVRRILIPAAAVLLLTALFSAAGILFVRHLGAILAGISPAFGKIFSSLERAELVPVPWASLVCAAGAVLSAMRIGRGRALLWLLPTAILCLMGIVTAILSVRANGIVFFDVLRPLTKTALSGGLDALG